MPGTSAIMPPTRPRIGVLFDGLSELTGSGGAERQFSELFSRYAADTEAKFELLIFTDRTSVDCLAAVGSPLTSVTTVLLPETGRLAANFSRSKALANALFAKQIDLVYVPLLASRHLVLLWYLGRRRRGLRIPIAGNALDCTLAHEYKDFRAYLRWPPNKSLLLYTLFFLLVPFDGLLTPYRRFRDRFIGLLRRKPLIRLLNNFVVDIDRFSPAPRKDNLVVWAGRLDAQKRPLYFVEAVEYLRQLNSHQFDKWRFEMYGLGPMRRDVEKAILGAGLAGKLILTSSPGMSAVFSSSRVFVSTQDFENVSSMALLEAMSAGNAVVVRPVGQTSEWIRSGENGVVPELDTPYGLAEALAALLSDDNSIVRFSKANRAEVLASQRFELIRRSLDDFWLALIGRARGRAIA